MEQTTFSPRTTASTDRIGAGLYRVAQTILFVIVGLLPLVFIPGMPGFMSGTKVFFVLLGLVAVVIVASLAMLRSGVLPLRISPLIVAWWAVVLASAISAALAPQLWVAFLGDTIEVHTVGFLAVAGVLMSSMYLLRNSGKSVVYMYLMLFASSIILSVIHLVRAFFGADWFSFGVLNSTSASLVGSFNDLALFLVLTVLIGLIALVQLALPRLVVGLLSGLIIVALVLLSVINFFTVWLTLSLFSLLLLMYTLTRDRFGDTTKKSQAAPSLPATLVTVVVFIVGTVFLVGGNSLGGIISTATGISYLEVRPSTEATLSILRQVYNDNAFTGSGPNHFSEVWRQYKDPSINETVFWNSTFSSGSGYIPTWFVTTGLLGVLAWLIFLGLFIYTAGQALLRPKTDDPFWYFVATITFVSGLFVWGMSLIYVPGPTILLLGAMSTGLLVVAHQMLVPKEYPTINLLTSARTGFVLIAIVMVVIISSILVGYQSTKQLMAARAYVQAVNSNSTDPAVVTADILAAYALYPSDIYMRDIATIQLLTMNQLLQQAEPGATDQQKFQRALQAGIEASTEAIRLRGNDARNWTVQGDIFTVLAAVNIDGAQARAIEAYGKAESFDPKNPYYSLQRALIATRSENTEEARTQAEQALSMKSNYTDALFLLSQLEIASGNLKQAIERTRSLVSLDVNNPGRYYQLGVLLSADNQGAAATDSFTAALTLNPDYANARYLRALEYFKAGNRDLALSELKLIRESNKDNTTLSTLIDQIERNEVTPESLAAASEPIPETAPVVTEAPESTATTPPDTDLLKPVNNINEERPAVTEAAPETAP